MALDMDKGLSFLKVMRPVPSKCSFAIVLGLFGAIFLKLCEVADSLKIIVLFA